MPSPGYTAAVPLLSERGLAGGLRADVIAPPPGELYSETNDNSVAILLTYGTARVLLGRRRRG